MCRTIRLRTSHSADFKALECYHPTAQLTPLAIAVDLILLKLADHLVRLFVADLNNRSSRLGAGDQFNQKEASWFTINGRLDLNAFSC